MESFSFRIDGQEPSPRVQVSNGLQYSFSSGSRKIDALPANSSFSDDGLSYRVISPTSSSSSTSAPTPTIRFEGPIPGRGEERSVSFTNDGSYSAFSEKESTRLVGSMVHSYNTTTGVSSNSPC